MYKALQNDVIATESLLFAFYNYSHICVNGHLKLFKCSYHESCFFSTFPLGIFFGLSLFSGFKGVVVDILTGPVCLLLLPFLMIYGHSKEKETYLSYPISYPYPIIQFCVSNMFPIYETSSSR